MTEIVLISQVQLRKFVKEHLDKIKKTFYNFTNSFTHLSHVFQPGADLGFCIHQSNAEGVRPTRGVQGHAPLENFEI